MMKSIILSLAILSVAAHAETKFNLSGDATVKAYNVNAHNVGSNTAQAFNQFFRVNADAVADEHLTVKTGLVLSSQAWEGDSSKPTSSAGTSGTVGGTNDNGTGNGNVTHLDHAYLEYAANGWITSVGRMAVSSPGNFLSSDDRRDRVQVLKISPTFDVLALVYDKRAAGSLTDTKDDLDMYSVNYYGSYSQFKYALQTGYWSAKKFNSLGSNLYNGVLNLDNIKQITPQLSTKILNANLDFYYTILWGGSAYYKGDHHAFALKVSEDLDFLKLEYQTVITHNGGLIAGGFDTLSSIVNSNPDHNQSSINLRNIGFGVGAKDADEYIHMMRVSKTFMNDFHATLGFGGAKLYVWSITNAFTARVEKNSILDATLKYDISKVFAANVKYGKFFGDNKDQATSLGVSANF